METYLEAVSSALRSAGLDAVLRFENPAAWEQVWTALFYQSVAYDSAMLDYQNAYYWGGGWQLTECSVVLLIGGRPCGVWPLTLGGPAGEPRLTSAGGPVLAPIFVPGLPARTIKRICTRAIAFIRHLCAKLDLPVPLIEQGTEPGMTGCGRTEWHQQLMAAGANVTLKHDLYADLAPPLAEIRAAFRKSYKPLINAGLRAWDVFVLDESNADPNVWGEFKQLHCDVSGRTTRSADTWAKQYEMLTGGKGFLVGLRDADARLVGAGFFQVTRDEGLYSVGVYDRALFDKPLGHVVQQCAIEKMKALDLRWYCIGERHYPQDLPAPTHKQVSISEFKQGFASHLFSRFQFVLPLYLNKEAEPKLL